jgi:GNAT superfamily N-acetyltransferase
MYEDIKEIIINNVDVEKHGTHDQSTHAGARRRTGEEVQPSGKKPQPAQGEQEVTDPNAPKPKLKPGRKPDATGTLEERAEKLANGERVEVTKKEVKKMVDILAKMSGNPDLTNMHIKDTQLYDEDNLGIPRNKMPQVPSDAKGQFITVMEQRGARVQRGVADPTKLHPIQAEISATKSAQISKSLKEKGTATDDGGRIIISRDNYIIDGHHRWAAAAMLAMDDPSVRLPVIKVDMDHKDLIGATLAWNEATGIQSIGLGESNRAGQIRKWAEFDAIVAKAVRKRTVIKFQPGLRPLIKHETHDQSTHGNWAGTRSSTGFGAEKEKQIAAYAYLGLSTDDLTDIFESGDETLFSSELSETYEITTTSGHEFRIIDTEIRGNKMMVSGNILDSDGNYAGEFVRGIQYDDLSDTFTAYHGLLELEESAQGQGIGSEFYQHNENYYLSKGFEAIKLEAALSVGPYAWAKKGFEFDDATADDYGYDNRGAYKNALEDFKRNNSLSEPTIAKINNLQSRLTSIDDDIRLSVQPIDIAMLYDGDRHIGKEIMTADNNDFLEYPPRYYAVKYLTPDGLPMS